jgi:hypothetical protein
LYRRDGLTRDERGPAACVPLRKPVFLGDVVPGALYARRPSAFPSSRLVRFAGLRLS